MPERMIYEYESRYNEEHMQMVKREMPLMCQSYLHLLYQLLHMKFKSWEEHKMTKSTYHLEYEVIVKTLKDEGMAPMEFLDEIYMLAQHTDDPSGSSTGAEAVISHGNWPSRRHGI